MATKTKKELVNPLQNVTLKPAEKDISGMTATDKIIAENNAANYKPDTKATFTSGKRQEFIPGTNTVKEYDDTGKLIYFGGNDAQSRMAVEQENAKLALMKTTPMGKPLINQERIDMVGTSQPNFVNTPVSADVNGITASIAENNRMHEVLANPSVAQQLVGGPGFFFLNKLGITGPDALNALSPSIGKKVANLLAKDNPKWNAFYNDYSNEANYEKIKTDLKTADEVIEASIAAASDPRFAVAAMYDYEEAMNQKLRSMERLKLISQGDQKEYVGKVKEDLTTLETYFSSQIKRNQDGKMRDALAKANQAAITMVK